MCGSQYCTPQLLRALSAVCFLTQPACQVSGGPSHVPGSFSNDSHESVPRLITSVFGRLLWSHGLSHLKKVVGV